MSQIANDPSLILESLQNMSANVEQGDQTFKDNLISNIGGFLSLSDSLLPFVALGTNKTLNEIEDLTILQQFDLLLGVNSINDFIRTEAQNIHIDLNDFNPSELLTLVESRTNASLDVNKENSTDGKITWIVDLFNAIMTNFKGKFSELYNFDNLIATEVIKFEKSIDNIIDMLRINDFDFSSLDSTRQDSLKIKVSTIITNISQKLGISSDHISTLHFSGSYFKNIIDLAELNRSPQVIPNLESEFNRLETSLTSFQTFISNNNKEMIVKNWNGINVNFASRIQEFLNELSITSVTFDDLTFDAHEMFVQSLEYANIFITYNSKLSSYKFPINSYGGKILLELLKAKRAENFNQEDLKSDIENRLKTSIIETMTEIQDFVNNSINESLFNLAIEHLHDFSQNIISNILNSIGINPVPEHVSNMNLSDEIDISKRIKDSFTSVNDKVNLSILENWSNYTIETFTSIFDSIDSQTKQTYVDEINGGSIAPLKSLADYIREYIENLMIELTF
ncbi:MAG: hypothetical protein MHPSP_001050, partial [Paramarteilia canceri]